MAHSNTDSPTFSISNLSESSEFLFVNEEGEGDSEIEGGSISGGASGFDSELDADVESSVDLSLSRTHSQVESLAWSQVDFRSSEENLSQRNELVADIVAHSSASPSDFESDSEQEQDEDIDPDETQMDMPRSQYRDKTPSLDTNPWRRSLSPTPGEEYLTASQAFRLSFPDPESSPSPPASLLSLSLLEGDNLPTDIESDSGVTRHNDGSDSSVPSFPLSSQGGSFASSSSGPLYVRTALPPLPLNEAMEHPASRVVVCSPSFVTQETRETALRDVMGMLAHSIGSKKPVVHSLAGGQLYEFRQTSSPDMAMFVTIEIISNTNDLIQADIPTLIIHFISSDQALSDLPCPAFSGATYLPLLLTQTPPPMFEGVREPDAFAPTIDPSTLLDASSFDAAHVILLPGKRVTPAAMMKSNLIRHQIVQEFIARKVLDLRRGVRILPESADDVGNERGDAQVTQKKLETIATSSVEKNAGKARFTAALLTRVIADRHLLLTFLSIFACSLCVYFAPAWLFDQSSTVLKPTATTAAIFVNHSSNDTTPSLFNNSANGVKEEPPHTITMHANMPQLTIDGSPIPLLIGASPPCKQLPASKVTDTSSPNHPEAARASTSLDRLFPKSLSLTMTPEKKEQAFVILGETFSTVKKRLSARHQRAKNNARRLTKFSQTLVDKAALNLWKAGELAVQ